VTGLVGWPAAIPSPSTGVWQLGPIPVRAYALAIILGIVVAVVIADRRWVARGGTKGTIADVALWAVPAGIVGARLYHVFTDWSTYFGPDGLGLVAALKIWQGGLGIWGAVAGGMLGAWYGARRYGLLLPPLADAVAPALAVAQAIGRLGNWANQELFGGPSSVPWAVQIDPAFRPAGYEQFSTFAPTFLYESLWCLLVAGLVVLADRRWRLGHGRAFALYVALYCLGRLLIEMVRIDEATRVFGLRVNIFTSILIGLAGVVYFVVVGRRHPGRETTVYRPGREPKAEVEAGADEASDGADEASDGAAAAPDKTAKSVQDPGGG